ncbi:hypothetical protein DL96DRAFT_267989 [Flagelloscypha sp. PMI_526]|nr:hypothetical protein DL96DRAFT_267989 [Flagelloscypha sp. PMI_526]
MRFIQPTIANLRDLPNDILLHIFSMCCAKTIVKLRQCCKMFGELSKDQTLWLSVLRRTCTDLDILVPSFPRKVFLGSDVELFATSWIRFQSVLKSTKAETPSHKIVRLIDPGAPVLSIRQSPDGQFLFILNSTRIQVWSLQTSSPTAMSSLPLEVPEDVWVVLAVELESTLSFVVHVLMDSPSQRLHKWITLRFKFSSHEPQNTQLDLISQLDGQPFSAEKWGLWNTKPMMPFLVTSFRHTSGDRYYLLWDFVRDVCVKWAADTRDTNVHALPLIVGDYIVAYNRVSQDMTVYARPDLPPKRPSTPDTCFELKISALLHIHINTTTQERQIVSSSLWTASSNGGYPVSLSETTISICDSENGSWLLERVRLSQTDSSSDTFTPLPLKLEQTYPVQIGDPLSFPISVGSKVYMFTDRSLLLYGPSKDKTQVVFHLSAELTEDRSGIEIGRGILYYSDHALLIQDRTYSLCPFMGRLCVTNEDGVNVVDFVKLPYFNYNLAVEF